MIDAAKIEAAAKAAFPELWPDGQSWSDPNVIAWLTAQRQAALSRVTAALQAAESAGSAHAKDTPTAGETIQITVPTPGARIITSTIGIVAYLDESGKPHFMSATTGDVPTSTHLGLMELVKAEFIRINQQNN